MEKGVSVGGQSFSAYSKRKQASVDFGFIRCVLVLLPADIILDLSLHIR